MLYLLAHGNGNADITLAIPFNTMHAPRAAKTNVCVIKTAINLHSHHSMHVQRYQGRWLTPPVNVRLVTRYVRIFDQLRLRYHRISHHRCRKVTLCHIWRFFWHRPRHRCRCRRSHFLSVVYSLGKTQSILHTCCKLSRHDAARFIGRRSSSELSVMLSGGEVSFWNAVGEWEGSWKELEDKGVGESIF